MRRDMDLLRELLLRLERRELPPGEIAFINAADAPFQVEGFSNDEVSHHLRMIESGGLVQTASRPFGPDGSLTFCQLSWLGRDFLDSVRDPKTWAKTKEGAIAAGGFTFDLLADLAKGFIKKQIEERTGVQL